MSGLLNCIGPGHYKVVGRISFATVLDYRDVMVALAAEHPALLVFDLNGLEVEGSVVLALLVEVYREAQRAGSQVSFCGCSEQVMQLAKIHDLEQLVPLSA